MKIQVETFITADIWRLSGTVKLRIYANQSFWTSDGQYIPQGTVGQANTAYLEVPARVAAQQLIIEGFEIDSTVDAIDNPWATYTAEIVAGNKRIPFLTTFAINTAAGEDPGWTWPEIILHRNMIQPRSIPESLDRQIAGLISLAVGSLNKASPTNLGVVAISDAAADPSNPIAVSVTSALWQALVDGTRSLTGSGLAVLVGGRINVPTAAVQAGSKITATSRDPGVTGPLRIENIVVGVSFDIVSSNGGDEGTVSWMMTN